MIPGLLPPLAGGQASMLPILQQAWLSRAATTAHNSFIQSMAAGGGHHHPLPSPYGPLAGFPGFPHHPFFLPPPPTTTPSELVRAHPPELIKTEPKIRYRSDEENSDTAAEDLSFSVKRFRNATSNCGGGEVICPICSIAVRWTDLPEHFETELRCLDNIRTLSPIVQSSNGTAASGGFGRPPSTSSHRSTISTSPVHNNNNNNKSSSSLSSSSLSPTSPATAGGGNSSSSYLENRWERFERIRNKRRERIGVRHYGSHHQQRQLQQQLQQQQQQQQQSRPRQHTVESMVAMRRRSEDDVMDEDIDIGEEDSISECGSGGGGGGVVSEAETNAALKTAIDSPVLGAFGPLQYTEADVLRSLSSSDGNNSDNEDKESRIHRENAQSDDNASTVGLRCPACRMAMAVPVLNVDCWHLKCERCWLRAVGTSQACSICHAAASVRELRKVHV